MMKPTCSTLCACLSVVALLAASGCRSSRKAVSQPDPVAPAATVGGAPVGGYDRSRPDSRTLRGEEKLLVDEALTWLGTPYRYGGQDYSGADCSGLTMEVYRKALGIKLPRTSSEQQLFCQAIAKSALAVGDLVFFCTSREPGRVSHVGLYIGDGKMIHSSGSKGVIISNIWERYYVSKYHSSGHVARPSDRERPAQPLETDPLRFDLDREVEARIDSIYAAPAQ